MDELKKTVGTVADVTVFRKLLELDYCTSYSHRGPGGPLLLLPSDHAADPDAVIAPLAAHHAMKRLADPDEVAAAALFLASDESTFVTGIAFAVDAGWTAM